MPSRSDRGGRGRGSRGGYHNNRRQQEEQQQRRDDYDEYRRKKFGDAQAWGQATAGMELRECIIP